MDGCAKYADVAAGTTGAFPQLHGGKWCARRALSFLNAMPAAFLAQMFAQQLARVRMKQTDIETIPLHLHATPIPPGGAL